MSAAAVCAREIRRADQIHVRAVVGLDNTTSITAVQDPHTDVFAVGVYATERFFRRVREACTMRVLAVRSLV